MKNLQYLNSPDRPDYRFESIMAELIEQGVLSIDEPIYKLTGIFNRAHKSDLTNVKLNEKKNTKHNTLEVVVSREGFYDVLPKGLFHGSKGRRGFVQVDDMIDESKKIQNEEKSVRKFFSPLEQEFCRKKIEVEIQERKMLDNFSNIFMEKLYGENKFENLSPALKNNLFYLLPFVSQIVGDIPLTEKVLSGLFDEEIQILRRNSTDGFFDSHYCTLGEVSLGKDFLCGSKMNDGIPSWEIAVGPTKQRQLSKYMHQGERKSLMKIVEDFFIPLECEVNWHILVENKEKGFVLDDKDHTARLGFSTYIC